MKTEFIDEMRLKNYVKEMENSFYWIYFNKHRFKTLVTFAFFAKSIPKCILRN